MRCEVRVGNSTLPDLLLITPQTKIRCLYTENGGTDLPNTRMRNTFENQKSVICVIIKSCLKVLSVNMAAV